MNRSLPETLGAAALIALFLFLQLLTVDYGVRINDVPYVAGAEINADVAHGSSLERDAIVSAGSMGREAIDLWLLRFKLYSVESDEIINIMSLARIKPQQGQFDPKFYQYGGAYLYPLGIWFYALDRLNVIHVGSLSELLHDPQRMDRVWICGRIFVLLAFIASALVLLATLRRLAPAGIALMLVALYLFCPASIMYSQVMKPHWYGLLWTNMVLFCLADSSLRRRLSLRHELVVGLGTGLAVGSALTYALFSVLVWIGLFVLVCRRIAQARALILVPATAVITFIAMNPYYIINWPGIMAERAATADWFHPSLDAETLLLFLDNSLFTGLGIALTILLLVIAGGRTVQPRNAAEPLLGLAVLVPLLLIGFLTASMATWHVNLRYASFVLPLGLILFAVCQWSGRSVTLAVVVVATIAQTIPLKLAYIDENDSSHSTRLRAAAWIDSRIPAGDSICLNSQTPSPYEVPPFRLDRYELNKPGCAWKVLVERETDSVKPDDSYRLVERFRPRFSPEIFPLVFGHINPQISIYRRA
jgi:hypothetical protein